MQAVRSSVTFRLSPHHYVVLLLVLVLTALAFIDGVQAQPTIKEVLKESTEGTEGKQQVARVQPSVPDDEFGRGIPRTSVQGFLQAAGEREFERAAQYLDLRNLPQPLDKAQGPELARQLNLILNRALWVDLGALSTDPRGHADDSLPRYRDRIARIKTPEKTFDILLQRVPRGDGAFIWKVSNRTVAEIPQLYALFGHGFLDEVLPLWVFDLRILGLYVWEWLALLVVGALAYVTVLVASGVFVFLLRRTQTRLGNQLIRFLAGPVRFLVWALLTRHWIGLLGPSVTVQILFEAGTILLIGAAWSVLRLIDFSVDRLTERAIRRGQPVAKVLLPPVGTALKVVLTITIVLVWLDNLGFEVTTLVAGLGIGGVAVALAAQKSLENVFGAITLYAARPVKVGDFCRFSDKMGTVEEIRLRSTFIRTLDNTVVSVPNAEFSNVQVENYSKREKIWYHPRIRLRYETTPDQLRYILIETRKLLYSHPKVLPDPARIRFAEFGVYSLDLDIFAYIAVTDAGEFLEVAEDLNLRIMEIVARAGSGFALPSQTTYVENGKGVDEERARTAEGQVKSWREQKALYLPNFPESKIGELHGSLDYPPIGSPGAAAHT